jgi:gliding motility associated protien GldN
LVTTQVTTAFDITSITKFRIIEDWIFDAQYGDMRPRIVAIAPLYNRISESGIDLGEAELFWLKMDDIRPVLAQRELFNRFNDAARISYDQWFEQRRFDSHIVKQSNVYDADIVYMEGFRDDGIEALLEAGKIKNDLFVMEHDFWEY